MPPFGVPARVELFPKYEPGLRHLEKHSHLWVIAWLHEAERDRLRVTPRGVSIQDETTLHGVFAVRSPTRPNPLALTAAKIERIEGNVIWVDQLDFIEGTPIIDLKPYFRSRDAIHSARSASIGQPDSRQAMLSVDPRSSRALPWRTVRRTGSGRQDHRTSPVGVSWLCGNFWIQCDIAGRVGLPD